MTEEEDTALLSANTIAQGYISQCQALAGDQSDVAESTLSLTGDERWRRPDVVAFQHGVRKGAQLVQRNRSSGQRGAEEYGKPLSGPEKLSAPSVPGLIHSKGDGAQVFMQLLASQQPLKQLEKMVPHGFQKSKLFEALIEQKVPLPRALWLIKIIYLDRVKQSSSERLKLWTGDVCTYIGELLREGLYTRSFVSRGGEFHAGVTATAARKRTAGSTATAAAGRSRAAAPAPSPVEPGDERKILESVREKWTYTVALARFSMSANILDQEVFLTSVVEIVEKAATTFGDKLVSAVIGMLVPILALSVPFATTLHRLTCRLAKLCTSVLQQSGKFATALDDSTASAVLDILRGLTSACPDAFVVSKDELPSLDELSHKHPGVEISDSLASSVKYIKARVDSLKKIESPSAISERVLDIVLVLDGMLGASHPDLLIEKFVKHSGCPAFSREKSSSVREDSLRALVHVVCDWATAGLFAEDAPRSFPSTLRRAVACRALKKFQLVQRVIQSESDVAVAAVGRDRPASTSCSRKPRDVVEASIYDWVSSIHRKDTAHSSWSFLQRSELVVALLAEEVTSLEGLTSQLMVDGTMDGAQLEEARYLIVFYGALLLRFTPAEEGCRTNASLKHIRGTCSALLASARSVLSGRTSGKKRKAEDVSSAAALSFSKSNDEEEALRLLRAPPSEQEIKEQVDALVKSSLAALSSGEKRFSDQQRLLFASYSSEVHPYVRWQFASQLARDAVDLVESMTLLPVIGMLQATGYLAPLLDFLVAVFNSQDARENRGISAEIVLSHMLSFETESDLISRRGVPESAVTAMKQRATASQNTQQVSDQGDVDRLQRIISAGIPVVAGDDVAQITDAESKAKGVGKDLAKACGSHSDSASLAACATRAAMLFFGERIGSGGQAAAVGSGSGRTEEVHEHLQVTLLAEFVSQLAYLQPCGSVHAAVASSLITFCDEYIAALLYDFTEKDNAKLPQDAVSSLLLRMIAEGFIPLRNALQVLVPNVETVETSATSETAATTATTRRRAFWIMRLLGPSAHRSIWVTLSLSAAQNLMSPDVVLQMIVPIAASVVTEEDSPSSSLLSSLLSHEPIRTALLLACTAGAGGNLVTIDQALMKIVMTCCSRHKITNVQSENYRRQRIAHVILKVMNSDGAQVNEASFERRACDVLSSLTVDKLSFQAAELKFLYMLMTLEAKAAFGGKNVSGMSETVAHQVDDKLSDIVLQASSTRDPSSSALIAELILFLGGAPQKLPYATLQKLSRFTSTEHDNGGIIVLTLLNRCSGNWVGQCVRQTIDSATKHLAAAGAHQPEVVWKQIRLLIPIVALVTPQHRAALSSALLHLLSLSWADVELLNVLVALELIIVNGHVPFWHTFAERQRKQVQQTGLPLTSPLACWNLPCALQTRLSAGLTGNHATETQDPWLFLAGHAGAPSDAAAAHWLSGAVRACRSSNLSQL